MIQPGLYWCRGRGRFCANVKRVRGAESLFSLHLASERAADLLSLSVGIDRVLAVGSQLIGAEDQSTTDQHYYVSVMTIL
jgi:hypothetical protein